MAFASVFKIGRPRAELQFSGSVEAPSSFRLAEQFIGSKAENAQREVFARYYRRARPIFTLTLEKISDATFQKLLSISRITDTPLSLIWSNALPVLAERYILDTPTSLTLSSTPETLLGAYYKAAGGGETDIIVPTAVYTSYAADGNPGGTNYYTSGSYSAATRTVTLGSSPGAAGTVVFVNYTFNGSLVHLLDKPEFTHQAGEGGALPLFDVTLKLEGA